LTRRRKLKPEQYGGFILGFEPARTDTIEEYLANGFPVSESFSSQDWNLQYREMIYLARQGDRPCLFGAAVLQKRGAGGGTKRVNLRSVKTILFDSPIYAEEAGRAETLEASISTSDNVIRFDALGWRELGSLVRTLRPHYAEAIDDLVSERTRPRGQVQLDARTSRLSEERDALGLALDIAGLDRRAIFRSNASGGIATARSILDIVDAQPIAERSLIESDGNALTRALRASMKTATFKDERGRGVRAFVLDSTPLETATGVDLLLYQEQYGSFLLLQYKAMEHDAANRTWAYKINGTNLMSQLDLMTKVREALPIGSPRSLRDIRLNQDPFYFKFCERRALEPTDEGLAAGLTMSAQTLERFLEMPESTVRSSLSVGYENCARYLNNSEFVALARGGWLGSQGATTDAIAKIIEAREGGRIAILAVIEGLKLEATNRR